MKERIRGSYEKLDRVDHLTLRTMFYFWNGYLAALGDRGLITDEEHEALLGFLEGVHLVYIRMADALAK